MFEIIREDGVEPPELDRSTLGEADPEITNVAMYKRGIPATLSNWGWGKRTQVHEKANPLDYSEVPNKLLELVPTKEEEALKDSSSRTEDRTSSI